MNALESILRRLMLSDEMRAQIQAALTMTELPAIRREVPTNRV